MAAPLTIIYADGDPVRAERVADTLRGAGFEVFPCSGRLPASFAKEVTRPDLVLVHEELGEELNPLIEALWPKASHEVMGGFQKPTQVLEHVNSWLRRSKRH